MRWNGLRFFDAHLDLACLVANGRDMDNPDLAKCGGPFLPAAVTLPVLRAANVDRLLGTIFTELNGNEPGVGYPAGDAVIAGDVGRYQLSVYERWWCSGRASRFHDASVEVPRIGILIEGADPIAGPGEVAWWASCGVIAIGLAWARGSRYAGGNTEQRGLTVGGPYDGADLIRAIDKAKLTHDVSHLSDASFDQLMNLATGPVMASHSNSRALLGDPTNQRHLSDRQIQAITARHGMIGLNLYSLFLSREGKDRRATLSETLDHVEHICALAASRKHVGLGSDMDGGLSALRLPEDIQNPTDLHRLADGLSDRGWTDEEVRGFAHENWERFFGIAKGG
jgi:membrane dipeptidase